MFRTLVRNRQAVTKGAIALALITIMAVAGIVIAAQNGVFGQFGVTPSQPGEPGAIPFFGQVSVTVSAMTPFNLTTTPAETSPSYGWYVLLSNHAFGSWGKSDLEFVTTFDGVANRPVPPEAQGQIVIRTYPGTAHYFAAGSTAEQNPRLIGCTNSIDADSDGELDWLCQINFSNISTPDPNQNPSWTYKVSMVAAATNTADYLNSPTDLSATASTNVGVTDTWATVDWEESIPSFTGRAYAKQELLSNRTGTSTTYTSEFRMAWSGMSTEGPYGKGFLTREQLINGIGRGLSLTPSTHDAGSGLIKTPDLLQNPLTGTTGSNLSASNAVLVYKNPNTDTSVMRFSWQFHVDFGSTADGEGFSLRNSVITPAGSVNALVADSSYNQDTVAIVA